jgi:L-iditol 2-dehydrogenase
MKALVLEEYNRLTYKEVPDPQVGPDDVLIRVKAAGICGSDVHGMDGSTGRRIPPLIMGHEASGVIADAGSNAGKSKPGQRVTFDSTVYCGVCFYCRRGAINLCDQRRVLGVACADYRQNGTFAEYVAVPRHIVYPLPDKITFEQSAMVEPCSVAFHAVAITPLSLNDTAVVVGAGIIGLLVIQTLRTSGCGQIIAVDLEPERLALARQLGADRGLNPGEEDALSVIKKNNRPAGRRRGVRRGRAECFLEDRPGKPAQRRCTDLNRQFKTSSRTGASNRGNRRNHPEGFMCVPW